MLWLAHRLSRALVNYDDLIVCEDLKTGAYSARPTGTPSTI
jgi:hypothetical protein